MIANQLKFLFYNVNNELMLMHVDDYKLDSNPLKNILFINKKQKESSYLKPPS